MLNESLVIAFLLILVRISSYFVSTPVLSMRNVPQLVKMGVVVALSFMAVGIVPYDVIEVDSIIMLGLLVVYEVVIGLAMGYATNIIFLGIQSAGDLIDSFAGLKMASSYDPITGTSGSMFSNLYNWIALILFLNMRGHHFLISGIVNTFFIIPIAQENLVQFELDLIVNLIVKMFTISIQLAIPLAIILFLVDVVLGMISRAIPQINVLMLSMPLKLFISVLAFSLLISGLTHSVAWALEQVTNILDVVIKSMNW